jgi:hypothetical protein
MHSASFVRGAETDFDQNDRDGGDIVRRFGWFTYRRFRRNEPLNRRIGPVRSPYDSTSSEKHPRHRRTDPAFGIEIHARHRDK